MNLDAWKPTLIALCNVLLVTSIQCKTSLDQFLSGLTSGTLNYFNPFPEDKLALLSFLMVTAGTQQYMAHNGVFSSL